MSYELKREDGRVIAEKAIKIPRSDEVVTAEVRNHLLDDVETFIVWYKSDGIWRIFVAGPAAQRFATKENA